MYFLYITFRSCNFLHDKNVKNYVIFNNDTSDPKTVAKTSKDVLNMMKELCLLYTYQVSHSFDKYGRS